MPRYDEVTVGKLSGDVTKRVQAEIEERAKSAASAIMLAFAQFQAPISLTEAPPNLFELGKSEAKRVSADATAKQWLREHPPI